MVDVLMIETSSAGFALTFTRIVPYPLTTSGRRPVNGPSATTKPVVAAANRGAHAGGLQALAADTVAAGLELILERGYPPVRIRARHDPPKPGTTRPVS